MQILKLEEDIKNLIENFSKENFIFDLLLVYDISKTTVTRAKQGSTNLAKKNNQLDIRNKIFFEANENENLHALIDSLIKDEKTYSHKPRFIAVTDYKTLLAFDTKTKETLDIEIKDLYKRYDFFLPWSGKEKYIAPEESIADRKAAEKMAKIYDEIVKENPDLTANHNHALNIFLTRLLFCFFAEDTLIFEDNQFTKAVYDNTKEDGSDLSEFLANLFESLDIENKTDLSIIFQAFPYVNGHLFHENSLIPKLTANIRKLIIECGNLNWKDINPDIFGSMFQAAASVDKRSSLGQHYTSVPNIMKVINPLFLDNLKEEFEKSFSDEKKLNKLLDRIYKLKIFDSACGSGNFLIIAYKQLRLLEMDILKRINELPGQHPFKFSNISLTQFYGIEIDDFACEIAHLSLWLAEHQMNRLFKDEFGNVKPALPLKSSGKIVCGNATRLNWEEICPKNTDDEIYILGNPPYLGFKFQNNKQKNDMDYLFSNVGDYKQLDYIACWFYKAAKYLQKNIKAAFVSTNSICQGSIVELLWEKLEHFNIEIDFAVKSFKWSNNAKRQAGVTCIIIGIRNICDKEKNIYTNEQQYIAKNINYYLIDAPNIIVKRQKEAISKFPKITDGSGALDGGFLILTDKEKEDLCNKDNRISEFILEYLGSNEYINGIKRWCIWIEDKDLKKAKEIPEINSRIQQVYNFRLSAGTRANTAVSRPHKFAWINKPNGNQIIIPTVSSENRKYIPMGFLGENIIISNSANVVHNPSPWIFGVLNSNMHMLWVKTVAGRLRSDIRYTSALCYNTFPFPDITDKQKQLIEMHVNNILAEREKHSEKTMAQLYDPEKMPDGLKRTHQDLDAAIDSCYLNAIKQRRPFKDDEERLKILFKMYEIMTDSNKSQADFEQLGLLL